MSEERKEEKREDEATAQVKEETAAPETEIEEPAGGENVQPETEKDGKKAENSPEEPDRKEKRRFGKKASKEEEKIAALEKENEALNDKFLRICAEYDNFRRRSQKEKDALYGDIKANTVMQFLPVYDNLERALKQSTEDEAFRKGIEMIMTQFCSTLEKLGVTEIDCLGKKFDPTMHNAVMHVEDEEKGENEIVEVFQKGFMLGDKVIRFAMVKVAN